MLSKSISKYTYPLDHISETCRVALSRRQLRSAYQSNWGRLRRASDNAESDFGFTGTFPNYNAIATWRDAAGAGLCYDATMYDQSGNGNDAVQVVVATQPLFTVPYPGLTDYDGVNDFIFHANISYATDTAFSFSVWIRWDNGFPVAQAVYPFGRQGTTKSTFIFKPVGVGNYLFYFRNEIGNNFSMVASDLSGVFDGDWHHVVITTTVGRLVSLYIDEVFHASVVAVDSSFKFSGIGKAWLDVTANWNGLIDDYFVFDGVLSPQSIKILYNDGLHWHKS